MTEIDTPTVHQAAALRYFAGIDCTWIRMRGSQASTQRACERRGWLESCDTWPHTRTTDAGREALARVKP